MNRISIILAICQIGICKKKSSRPPLMRDVISFGKIIAVNPDGLVNAKVGPDQSTQFTIVESLGPRPYSYDYEAVLGTNHPEYRFLVRVVPVAGMANSPIGDYWKRELFFHKKFSELKNVVKVVNKWFSGDCMFVVYESCAGGSLLNKATPRGIEKLESQKYFNTMISVVESMHQQGVVHGDLQLSNWMFCSEILKLSNFGFASSKKKVTVYHGSISYRSPECLSDKKCWSASDVWSLGIGLVHMLSGVTPIGATEPNSVDVTTPTSLVDDSDGFDLLSRLLAVNPSARLTIEQAAGHVWVKNKNIPDMPITSKWAMEEPVEEPAV